LFRLVAQSRKTETKERVEGGANLNTVILTGKGATDMIVDLFLARSGGKPGSSGKKVVKLLLLDRKSVTEEQGGSGGYN